MRAFMTSAIVLGGYLLLLFVPELLQTNLSFTGFLALDLAWFAVSTWLAWLLTTPAVACAITGLSIVGVVSAPVNMIAVGCYIFGQCP
ncbi:hypothetical protein [Sphingomonas sp.]|uniref:hypothetical protein n=1 Tax=Sphingomonas sp. TaxID=28214 RepID=UPI002FDA9125